MRNKIVFTMVITLILFLFGFQWIFAAWIGPTAIPPDGNLVSSSGGNWIKDGLNIYYNDGSVGINTNSPQKTLHVASNAVTSDSFEVNLGGLTNSTIDTCDWLRDSGGTPSNSTGPAIDHTLGTGSGFYSFVETSSGSCNTSGDIADIESATFDADLYPTLSVDFWYHMYGANIGTLYVDVYDTAWNTEWSISGQQQTSDIDSWTNQIIDLSAYSGNIKIRFRVVAAGGWTGDVAIDDVVIGNTGSGEMLVERSITSSASINSPKYCDENGNNCIGAEEIGIGVFEETSSVVRQGNTPAYNEDFVFGSPQLDDDGISTHDNRMFFDKSNGAFRAGYVSGTQWDEVNIGGSSAAFGVNTQASGAYSAAFGNRVNTSGLSSFGVGYDNTTSGDYSFIAGYENSISTSSSVVFGYRNTVTNTGKYGFITGRDNVVSAGYAMAHGWDAKATGISSVAMGYSATSSGVISFAFGQKVVASGGRSVVLGGYGNTASGDSSSILGGSYNTASGNYSSVLGGGDNTASEDSSVVLGGYGTVASGGYSVASGYKTTASGDNSFAIGGYGTVASGYASFASGYNSTSSGDVSFAIGASTVASNYQAFASGYRTIASGVSSFAIGESTVASKPQAFASGYRTIASATSSFAIGESTVASGIFSFASGYNSTSSGYSSISSGITNVASGHNSIAMGHWVTAAGIRSTAIGLGIYNDANSSFMVGFKGVKETSLTADPGLFVTYDNEVGIKTSSISTGLALDVEGKVGAAEYCDQDGNNCFTATSTGTGEAFYGTTEGKSVNVTYQAPYDGIITAFYSSGSNCSSNLDGLTDINNPPTTRVAYSVWTTNLHDMITFPVKKGEYWKVADTSGASACNIGVEYFPMDGKFTSTGSGGWEFISSASGNFDCYECIPSGSVAIPAGTQYITGYLEGYTLEGTSYGRYTRDNITMIIGGQETATAKTNLQSSNTFYTVTSTVNGSNLDLTTNISGTGGSTGKIRSTFYFYK